MFKKILAGVLIVATSSLFGMSVGELNKASREDLMQIKGIGGVKADAIIAYRKTTPFKTIEDVEEVKGVGPALAENIKNDVKGKNPDAKADGSTKSPKKASAKKAKSIKEEE